jgi:hypothetical protein
VELDGLVGDKERGADLLVRLAVRHLERDLQLLSGQLLDLGPVAAAKLLAAGA